jgi:hypothetical protein
LTFAEARDGQQTRAGFVFTTTNKRRTVSETTETIEIASASERSKVESWRLHVLMEAGYPLPLAERLAASEADLHLAVALVENGCGHTTAAEILL